MLPVPLIGGALIGRLWVIPLAALAWPATVALLGDCAGSCLLVAAGLGAANATVGVAVRRAVGAAVTRR